MQPSLVSNVFDSYGDCDGSDGNILLPMHLLCLSDDVSMTLLKRSTVYTRLGRLFYLNARVEDPSPSFTVLEPRGIFR